MEGKKYCKHCGEIIDKECVVCPKCGKQVEEIFSQRETPIIINNSASSSASASASSSAAPIFVLGKPKNKWISLLLCLFTLCGHKFYEGKFFMGILYLFTCGLFFVGWIIDIFVILCKPNPYYV